MKGEREARRGARSGYEKLARLGFLTKGVVYLLVGGLALVAVFGSGGQVSGGEGAVRTIGQQPFGKVLLTLTAIGLFGYALFRLVQAAFDPEQKSDEGWKNALRRVGYLASAGLHVVLGVAAVQMAYGGGGGGGGQSKRSVVAELLAADPLGPLVIAAVGVGAVAFGVRQLVKAWTIDFAEELKLGEMSPSTRRWAIRAGRTGLAARGVVFPIIGVALVRAAIQSNPSEVKGVGGAMREIASNPFGTFLLVVVAAGLFAYGVYQVVLSRYRRLHLPV